MQVQLHKYIKSHKNDQHLYIYEYHATNISRSYSSSVLPDAFDALLQAAGHLHQPALLVSLSERSLVHLHGHRIHC